MQKFSDNARALLTVSIAAGATSLTIEAGKADRFPVANTSDWLTPADWFKATLIDSAGNREVVKVGTRASGANVLGNLQRAQDGTTALSFTAGAVVMLAVVAKDIEDALAGVFSSQVQAPSAAIPKYLQSGVEGRIIPVGGIVMWSGTVATIPLGWALCDGTSGTPDLRDRFIIGARQDDAGTAKTNITGALTQTGGSKDAIAVAHTHSFAATTGAAGAHSHSINDPGHSHTASFQVPTGGTGYPGMDGSGDGYTGGNTGSSGTGISINGVGDHTHSVSGTTGSTGSAGTNANLTPYYALAFIMALAA